MEQGRLKNYDVNPGLMVAENQIPFLKVKRFAGIDVDGDLR